MQREELAYGHMSFASRDPVFIELGLKRGVPADPAPRGRWQPIGAPEGYPTFLTLRGTQTRPRFLGFFGGKGKGASPKGDFSDAVVGPSRGGI